MHFQSVITAIIIASAISDFLIWNHLSPVHRLSQKIEILTERHFLWLVCGVLRSALFLLKVLTGDLVDIGIIHGSDIHNYSTRHYELIRIPNIPVSKTFGVFNIVNQANIHLNSFPSLSLQYSSFNSKKKLLCNL